VKNKKSKIDYKQPFRVFQQTSDDFLKHKKNTYELAVGAVIDWQLFSVEKQAQLFLA
jgi:hypothetical protein